MRLKMLFVLLSLWTCALLNPGNLGTIDTVRRLQVTRWIWLGQPAVRSDDVGAGLIGRNGVQYPPYGIGQSLVMLPFDAFASTLLTPAAQRFGLDDTRRSQIIELAIAFLMQSFLTSSVLILGFEVLGTFGFSRWLSAAGALALLFATTLLQYVQSAQENLLLVALALLAFWSIRRFGQTPETRWALLTGAAAALAVLVRLTSVLETGVFGLYALTVARERRRFLGGFLAPLIAALLIDRWYQYFRFGELFSTYMRDVERQFRPPGAPEKFLFSYPFLKGFLGELFSPDKSILFFDPLLLILFVLVVWNWRKLGRDLRLALGCLSILLVSYPAFYAKYYYWDGNIAWGDRFVLLPVEMLCLFAAPLLLASPRALTPALRRALWAVVALSVILQAASTVIAPNLEVMQRQAGYAGGAIWNRAVNLVCLARGQTLLARFRDIPIEWRTLYYFPFQLRFRFPSLAPWAIGLWLMLLAAFPLLIIAIVRAARAMDRPIKPELAPAARIP